MTPPFWPVNCSMRSSSTTPTWRIPPARALGVSESTTRRHLDLLTDAFMIRQLQPFHANLRKRQVKSPKIYVCDSGLLHRLLGIGSLKALLTPPSSSRMGQ
jgi:hypothetical protein